MNTASHFIASLFRHNITLALPVLVLFFKFGVRWFTREPLKDVFKSLLVIPLDFMYIATGLLLAALARRIPQFATKYGSDREADFYGAIMLALLFLSASLITWMDRKVRLCWQKAFAASALIKDFPQLHLPENKEEKQEKRPIFNDEYVNTWVWLLFYWVVLVSLFFAECALSVICLGGILGEVT